MKVTLIGNGYEAIKLMALACRTCTGKFHSDNSGDTLTNFVKKILRSGHESIAEHVNFTFLIEGISRACSHQLVRYRHCSFSQLSQRYAKVGTITEAYAAHYACHNGMVDEGIDILSKHFVLPEEDKKEENESSLREELSYVFVVYHEAMERGVKPENARAILPNCTKTDLLMTVNLRELMHICNERLCTRAQGEIRELVQKMRDLVLENLPELEEFLVPKCKKYGHCFEEKSCGLMPKIGD